MNNSMGRSGQIERRTLFDKKCSTFCKGYLVITMFWAHMFAHPDRLWNGVEWKSVFSFCGGTIEEFLVPFFHVAVPLFFFISGYAFFVNYNSDVSFDKLLRQIRKIFVKYWFVFAIFIPICMVCGKIEFNIVEFLLNLSSLSSTYCGEWWFLSTYVEIILFWFCLIHIYRHRNKRMSNCVESVLMLTCSLVLAIGGYGLSWVLGKFHIEMNGIISEVYIFLLKQPMFVIGYVIAKGDLLNKLYNNMQRKKRSIRFMAHMILALIVFVAPLFVYIVPETFFYVLYLPFFAYAFSILYIHLSLYGGVDIVFTKLGQASTYMWLTHSILLYKLIQPIIYFLKWSVLCWLVLIVISYVVGSSMNLLEKKLCKVFTYLRKEDKK